MSAGGLAIEQSSLFNARRDEVGSVGGHHSARSFLRESGCAGYDLFTMVRNPCSRLYQLWRYYAQQLGNDGDKQWAEATFDANEMHDFNTFVIFMNSKRLHHLRFQQHFRSQVGMIMAPNGSVGMKQVLVMEKWTESLERLGRLRSDPPLDVSDLTAAPSANSITSARDDECANYTAESWRTMTQFYALDFCVLGYDASSMASSDLSAPSLDQLQPEATTRRLVECCERLSGSAFPECSKVRRDGRRKLARQTLARAYGAALENGSLTPVSLWHLFSEFSRSQKLNVRQAFRRYDRNNDYHINALELHAAMRPVLLLSKDPAVKAMNASAVVETMMRAAVQSKSGYVGFPAFNTLMQRP